METPPVDWKVYDPSGPDIESFVAEGAIDYVDELEGPWSPLILRTAQGSGQGSSTPTMIDAMVGIIDEGRNEDDLFDHIDFSPTVNVDPPASVSPSLTQALEATQAPVLPPQEPSSSSRLSLDPFEAHIEP